MWARCFQNRQKSRVFKVCYIQKLLALGPLNITWDPLGGPLLVPLKPPWGPPIDFIWLNCFNLPRILSSTSDTRAFGPGLLEYIMRPPGSPLLAPLRAPHFYWFNCFNLPNTFGIEHHISKLLALGPLNISWDPLGGPLLAPLRPPWWNILRYAAGGRVTESPECIFKKISFSEMRFY